MSTVERYHFIRPRSLRPRSALSRDHPAKDKAAMGTTSPLPAGDRTYSADSRVLAPPLKLAGIRREREVVPTARRAIRARAPASTPAHARAPACRTLAEAITALLARARHPRCRRSNKALCLWPTYARSRCPQACHARRFDHLHPYGAACARRAARRLPPPLRFERCRASRVLTGVGEGRPPL